MRTAVRTAGRVLAPAGRLTRAVRRQPWLTVLGWHRFGGREHAGDGMTTTLDGFRRHLDVLEEWGARVVPLGEAVRRLADGTLPDRAVVLTFDDGYASVVEQAWPMLRERGLPATLFAVSRHLDPCPRLPWDRTHPDGELVRLVCRRQLLDAAADGLEVGSHTRTHPWLPHRPDHQLADELSGSRADLEDLLGRRVPALAYPAGGWDGRVRRAAAAAGYTVGITVDRGISTPRVDRLLLRRAFAPERADDLRQVLDGGYTWLRPLDAWRHRTGLGQG